MKKTIWLGLMSLVVAASAVARADVCDLSYSNGYYSVQRGGQQVSDWDQNLSKVLGVRDTKIKAGVCTGKALSACDLSYSKGYFSVARGKDRFSDWNQNLADVLKTRNTFVKAGLCSSTPISDCVISHDNGYYSVKRGDHRFSDWSRDLQASLGVRQSLIDEKVCKENDQASADHASKEATLTLGGLNGLGKAN